MAYVESSKIEATWYEISEDFNVPNKIQLKEYSMGSGIDGISYDGLGGLE